MQAAEMKKLDDLTQGVSFKSVASAVPAGASENFGAKFQIAVGGNNTDAQAKVFHRHATDAPPLVKVSKPDCAAQGDTKAAGGDEARVEQNAVEVAARLPVVTRVDPKEAGGLNPAVMVGAKKEEVPVPGGERTKPKRGAQVGNAPDAGGFATQCEPAKSEPEGAMDLAALRIVAASACADAICRVPANGAAATDRAVTTVSSGASGKDGKVRTTDNVQLTSGTSEGPVVASNSLFKPLPPLEFSTKHSALEAALPAAAVHASEGISGTQIVNTAALPEPAHRPLAIDPQSSAERLSPPFGHSVAVVAARNVDHQVVAAGPTHLDVGVFDGTHGWLRIRAELGSGGAVNASLTASSSAHLLLKSDVPEMAKYLSSEAVGVSKIAIHRFDASNTTPAGTSGGNAASFAQGGHNGRQSGSNDGNFGEITDVDVGGEGVSAPWSPGLPTEFAGGWLNVSA